MSPLSVSGQGVRIIRISADKPISRLFFMVLLRAKYIKNLPCPFYKCMIKLICTSRIFPDQVSQLNGIAKRIHFVFPLPEPIVHLCLILLPAISIGFLIKCICIGVNTDIQELTMHHSHQNISNIFILLRRDKIRTKRCC